MIGSQDLLIALAIGPIMFGAKRLPELARGLGESVKEFKKGITNEPDPAATAPTTPPAPALASAPPSARKCATCQTSLLEDWSHCPKCGAAAVHSG